MLQFLYSKFIIWSNFDISTSLHPIYSQQPDLGVFIPECNPQNGAFLAEQCNATSGVCWCVDTNGEEKPDTHALMNQERRNCSKFDNKSNVAGGELLTPR